MIFRTRRKYIFRDESHFQPSLLAAVLALAAAVLLSWHSMARADAGPPAPYIEFHLD